jgi:hypothetical protein
VEPVFEGQLLVSSDPGISGWLEVRLKQNEEFQD